MSNIQDFFGESNDGALSITNTQSASIVWANTTGQIHMVGAATGGTVTVNLPNNNGTLLTNINLSASNASANLSNVVFSNSNGVSFGLNGSTVTASYTVPTVTNSSWTVSDNATSLTISRLAFTNSNGLTMTLSTGAGAATVIGSYTVPTVTNSSWTVSDNATSGTVARLAFTNQNGVTLSLSTGAAGSHTVVGSVAAQSNQTAGIYASSQTTGQSSSSTHDARSLTIVGSNQVSVGWSNSSLIIAATTAAQTNQTVGLYASSQTTAQSSSSTVDARSISIVGQGNISVGLSAGSFIISQTGGGGGGFSGGVSTGGNTLGNTGTQSGQFVLVGSNNITLSVGTAAGGAQTVTISGPTQSNQTAGIYITAQSTGQSSSSTYDARTLSMVGDGIVSIGWSNSTLRVSATQSNQAFSAAGGSSAFQTLSFADTNGISWTNTNGSVALLAPRMTISATSNTTQSSTGTMNLSSMIFAGAGIASVGVTNGSIVVSVPTGGGAGDGGVFAGVSTAGNTAGSTGTVSTGNFVLVGSGPISLSQSTGAAGSAATVTINAPATSSLVGVNGISISTNGSTISISNQQWTAQFTQPEVWGNTLTTSHANGTVYMRPIEVDNYLNVNRYAFEQSFASSNTTMSVSGSVSAGNASSGTGSWGQSNTILMLSRVQTADTAASFGSIVTFDSKTVSLSAGYSLSASWSTNASSATVSFTTSAAMGYLKNVDSAGAITTSSTSSSASSSFSSTSTNANSFSSSFVMSFPLGFLSGIRPLWAPGSGTNMPPGEYWVGLIQSTQTGSTNYPLQRVAMVTSPGILYYTGSSNNSYLEYGNSANIASSNFRRGFGSFSASSATTANINLSAITSMASNASMWFAILGKSM